MRTFADLPEAPTEDELLRRPSDLGRAAWLAARLGAERVKPGKVVEETYARGSFAAAGLPLAWRLPDEYDPAGPGHALIVAVPDADEGPAEHLRARWISPAVKERAIVVVPAMPRERERWTRVMVDGRPGGVSHVLTALRVASERFAVDPDRVYVVGHGKSVPAALFVANYGPQQLAGVVGRAGDVEPLESLRPDNLANLPILLAGYGSNATAFQEAAAELGGDVRLDRDADEDAIWSWMAEHPRRTYPTRVTVVPGQPFPTRAYWLRIQPSAPDARIVAEVDRERSTVRIDGTGASRVVVHLNDALVDLDQPLRLIVNGVERTERVPRSLGVTLDLLRSGTSDPRCVYVAEASVDLSADAARAGATDGGSERAAFLAALAEAGTDVAALWRVHDESPEAVRQRFGPIALRRIVRLAPDDERAREALGHVRAPGDDPSWRWFSSPEALARFESRRDEQTAEARGLVRSKDRWLHREQRPLASRGWVQDPETGAWLTVEDRKRLAAGWARQDLAWIAPDEAGKVDEGLWRVDGEWCTLAEAARRRARLGSMWRIPGADVRLSTTVDRDVALRARAEMAGALDDLRKVFGAEPPLPLDVALVREEEQFDRLAFGDPDGRRLPTHAGRLHVVHTAFFAESWFEREDGELVFRGMGVGLWDADAPHGDLYGRHSARLAAGLSYVEALDPSPKAVRRAVAAGGPTTEHYAAYLAEKTLPAWLRWGGAVYAERYFEDRTVAEDGDPWWARAWSVENLKQRGGLRPVRDVLALPLDPDDRDDGLKLLIEAGLLVAFVVDGDVAPLAEAHAGLKRRLAEGKSPKREIEALEELLLAHEAELRAFAGL